MAKFINRREIVDEPQDKDGRVIYFSKSPRESSDEQNSGAKDDQHDKTEYSKLLKSQENEIFTKPTKKDKVSTISSLIEEEKKELNNIHKLIRKQSSSLERAKKLFKEKQSIIERELNKKSSRFSDDKFTIVGQLSSRMAHDIRNPLNVIKVQVDLLKLRYSKQEDTIMLESLERMEKAVHGITNQLNDVLNFLKDSPVQLEKVRFHELVEDSLSYIQLPEKVTLAVSENDVVLSCDKAKMERLFVNLIQNSIDAIEKEGTVTIEASEREGEITLQFKDTGCGIPEEMISKIFDPLFTTKHNGTGLGLAICAKIVEDHNGAISVGNNPTTFSIRLPK